MQNDRVVGTVTSGAWGHRVGMNLAYAFLETDVLQAETAIEADLCGELAKVHVIDASPYDPSNALMRQ